MSRPRIFVTAVAVLALLGSGCSSSGETPQAAAQRLAKGLTAEKLVRTPFEGRTGKQVQRWWTRTVAGMEAATHTVRVASVSDGKDGDSATARLAYRWSFPGTKATWSYRTAVQLTRGSGDRWVAKPAPTMLAPNLKADERLQLGHEQAPRGDILGAGGSTLVTERPVLHFGIDKAHLDKARQAGSARRLATVLNVDAGSFVQRVETAGDKAFVEAIVLRRADVTRTLSGRVAAIPGAIAIPDQMPLAPTREFARPILGTVGPVTAEILKQSKGVYRSGDEAGLSGLEQRYDGQLRGAPGVVVSAVSHGGAAHELFSSKPVAGKPLRITLEPRLQALAERVLGGVGPASAVVAVRPSDGHVLAAASGPGSQGYSTATLGLYAPGSTFKVVSSLALLRSGLTPGSTLPCTPTIVVNGKSFKNYSDYPSSAVGRIPLRTAVADSCNTAFISQHGRVSQRQLIDAAAALGFGVDHDLGFPVFLGSLSRDGSEPQHAASMIGQGKVLAAPIAMATVAASVGAGRTVVPLLVPAAQPHDPGPPHPLTAAEAGNLRGLMRGVVLHGSGSILAGLPGPPVLAKTGTAEFGNGNPPQTHAWMIAVHGDLAVAVFVSVGQSGSQTAGPILERFLRGADTVAR